MKHIKIFESFLNEGRLRNELVGGKGQKAEYDSLTTEEKNRLENLWSQLKPDMQNRVKKDMSLFQNLKAIEDRIVSMLDRESKSILRAEKKEKLGKFIIRYYGPGEVDRFLEFIHEYFDERVFLTEKSIIEGYMRESPHYIVNIGNELFAFYIYKDSITIVLTSTNGIIPNSRANVSSEVERLYKLIPISREYFMDLLKSMELGGMKETDVQNDVKIQDFLKKETIKKYDERDLDSLCPLIKILSEDSIRDLKEKYPDKMKEAESACKGKKVLNRFLTFF